MDRNRNHLNEHNLEGNELTQEQLSDVYTSGTSDGVQKLAAGNVIISDEAVQATSANAGTADRIETEQSSPADCI